MVKFSTTKERQRTLKKELSDRLLGPVGYPGRIALEGAPAADFLQSLSGAESISDIVGWALKVTGQDGWKTRVPGWSVGMQGLQPGAHLGSSGAPGSSQCWSVGRHQTKVWGPTGESFRWGLGMSQPVLTLGASESPAHWFCSFRGWRLKLKDLST